MRSRLTKRMNKRGGSKMQVLIDDIEPNKDMQQNQTWSEIEYGYFGLNTQASKPFVALANVKTFFNHDTQVQAGDLIIRQDMDIIRKYLVTVKNPDIFKNKIVRHMTICYLCNSLATIERKSTDEDATTLEMTTSWNNVCLNVDCLVTEGFYGEEKDKFDYGDIMTDKQEMFIQNGAKVEIGDKVVTTDTSSIYGGNKTLYIEKVKRHFFSGIDYCILTTTD